MKILYLHPRSWTGEYPVLLRLRDLGHEVCVLEEDRKLPGARHFASHFEHPGDGIVTFWYNPRKGLERVLTWPWDRVHRKAFDGRNLAHRAWIIVAATKHFRPDVVVTSDGFSYAIPAARLRRGGKLAAPLVVSYIGGDILDCPEADVGRRRTPAVTRLIRDTIAGADLLRPVSPLIEGLLRAEGAAPERIHLCPSHLVASRDVLDRLHGERRQVRAAIRAELGIPQDAPAIITLSGNQKGKGLHILAEAWPAIRAAVPGVHWLFCGPATPWIEEAVRPRLRAANAEAGIVATNALAGTRVFEHLAAADLHVNPSLCESLNMVTVEAAAVGTPTVGTDGAGIAAWMERYGAGTVVPAGRAAPLADAIIFALKDPARLAAWSAAGREMIAEFTLDRVAAQLVALFEHARGSRTEP